MHLGPNGRPAVPGLTVGFGAEYPHAFGDVLWIGRRSLRASPRRSDRQRERQRDAQPGELRRLQLHRADPEADHAFVRTVLLRRADLRPFLERTRRTKLAALRR